MRQREAPLAVARLTRQQRSQGRIKGRRDIDIQVNGDTGIQLEGLHSREGAG